jgi:hypothetical protein
MAESPGLGNVPSILPELVWLIPGVNARTLPDDEDAAHG